jgi:hypothetical protein
LLYPIGSVVQGALADEVGLRATTTAAALILAASFVVVRMWRPGFDRDLGDAVGPAADLGSTTVAPTDQ